MRAEYFPVLAKPIGGALSLPMDLADKGLLTWPLSWTTNAMRMELCVFPTGVAAWNDNRRPSLFWEAPTSIKGQLGVLIYDCNDLCED